MNLNIRDEFSPLKEVVVCWGYHVHDYQTYFSSDPEFTKYPKRPWDNSLLLKQQEKFFKALEKYKVNLRFPKTSSKLPWQIFVRDTGFVINDCFYYSNSRGFKERIGEEIMLLDLFKSLKITKIQQLTQGKIEGGDVLVDSDIIYIGHGGRSEKSAINELLSLVKGEFLFLGENVMHLDTRFTILPDDYCLIVLEAFQKNDLEKLGKRFKFIPVSPDETIDLTTNVLAVNPETIFSPKHNKRINKELQKVGFHIEEIDYTEGINLRGSFRCTSLPLVRG